MTKTAAKVRMPVLDSVPAIVVESTDKHFPDTFGKEEIIKCLSAIASADICDFIEIRDGNAVLRSLDEIPPYSRLAVESVKNSAGGRAPEIHFYDRLKAVDMLCKCLGFYSPDKDDSDIMEKLDTVLDTVAR